MSQLGISLSFELISGAEGYEIDPSLICRDEACQELSLHTIHSGACKRRRLNASSSRTRSKIFANEPWRAYCYDALRDSVLGSVSSIEPRSFMTIVNLVENDYGSCCERTIHRHLRLLRSFGKIVRMDFKGRLHAYLRAGSRLLSDRGLVFEQIQTTLSNDFGRFNCR